MTITPADSDDANHRERQDNNAPPRLSIDRDGDREADRPSRVRPTSRPDAEAGNQQPPEEGRPWGPDNIRGVFPWKYITGESRAWIRYVEGSYVCPPLNDPSRMLGAYRESRAPATDGAGRGPLPTSLTAAPCPPPRRSRKASSTTGPALRYGLLISATAQVPPSPCLGIPSGSCCRSFALPAGHFPTSSNPTPLSIPDS